TAVLAHSGPGAQSVFRLDLEDRLGLIRVIDVGRGFDSAGLQAGGALPEDERGPGLGGRQALVRRVDFPSRPEAGTIVTLEKVVTYRDEALMVGRRPEV